MQDLKAVLLIGLSFVSSIVYSQEVLTLETSIQQAMENNYNIKVAKNTVLMAEEQATKGNAGLLPTLSANGNAGFGINNSKFEILGTPEQRIINGAQSINYGGGVQLSYLIYNGMGTFNSYKKLKKNSTAAEIQSRMQIENILMQTTQTYYQVVQAQNNLAISAEALEISKERKERAQLNFEMAGGAKLDWLNAQVDFNADSVQFINASNGFKSSQLQLNQIIGKGSATDYTVDNVIVVDNSISVESIQAKAKENNSAKLNAEYAMQLSDLDIKLAKSKMQPSLSFQSGYNYNHVENEASVLAFQQSTGWSSSLQLSIPLFDGNKKNIQTNVAKIKYENAQYAIQETETVLERDIQVAFNNYQNGLQVAALDKQSVETAQLNFDRSKEFLAIGQISNTQFREAQLNLLRVKNQALNNQLAIKLYEVELIRLSGELVQ